MAAIVTFDAEAAHASHEALLDKLRSHRDGLVAELNKVDREIVGTEKLITFFAGAMEQARQLQAQPPDGEGAGGG